MICYVISFDKLCNLLNNIKIVNNFDKRKDESLDSKLYFALVSTLFYIIINLCYYIPYIGHYLCFMLTACGYGYFCLEYCCYYKNIVNKEKLAIMESNPYFFVGYGIIYAILVEYNNYINFFAIFVTLFPLSVIKLTKTNIYELKYPNNTSKIFILPMIIVNTLLSIIDSYIMGEKYVSCSF